MAPTEFHEAFSVLGLPQHRIAALFDVSSRAVRRWRHGDRRVPCGVTILLRLMAAGTVTLDEVERAAVPVSARTNGRTASEAGAMLLGAARRHR
jgi:hypothetical protein